MTAEEFFNKEFRKPTKHIEYEFHLSWEEHKEGNVYFTENDIKKFAERYHEQKAKEAKDKLTFDETTEK